MNKLVNFLKGKVKVGFTAKTPEKNEDLSWINKMNNNLDEKMNSTIILDENKSTLRPSKSEENLSKGQKRTYDPRKNASESDLHKPAPKNDSQIEIGKPIETLKNDDIKIGTAKMVKISKPKMVDIKPKVQQPSGQEKGEVSKRRASWSPSDDREAQIHLERKDVRKVQPKKQPGEVRRTRAVKGPNPLIEGFTKPSIEPTKETLRAGIAAQNDRRSRSQNRSPRR